MRYLDSRPFSTPVGPEKVGPKTADWEEIFGASEESEAEEVISADELRAALARGEAIEAVTERYGLDIAPSYRIVEYAVLVHPPVAAGPAILLPGWWVDVGGQPIYYPDEQSGQRAAERYVSDGDWPEDGDSRVRVTVWREGLAVVDGDVVEARAYEDEGTVPVPARTAARRRVAEALSAYWGDPARYWDGERYRLSAETESGSLDEIVSELNDGALPAGWFAEWTGDEMDLVVERVDD